VVPLPVLLPDGALGAPCPPFMFGQLCVGFAVDAAEGVAAAELADPALPVVVPDVEDDAVDDDAVEDVVVAECVVEALATAMLAPSPTPSAPKPTALPIMILPSLVFNVSASKR
jgi:hypothetical protein